ncbi:MAG: membrane integrity-associated transporter subunit PqiC [Desulfobacteraceae bacterium]|nr:MAG: membrane integrity-associated transporter subunit PqiC [Desulfobacteraceae bacterium]
MSALLRPRMRAFLLLILLSAGCRAASPPIAYYTLGSAEGAADALETSSTKTTIGIGPVSLPQYLDRPQLVTRTGPHRLRFDDFHLWAGSLSEEIARVVAENLMLMTRSPRVARLPWGHRFRPDIVIGIEVLNFEAHADGRVHLMAAVALSDRRSDAETTWTVDLKEEAGGRSIADLVAAQSRLIAELSRRIAAAIP